MNIKVKRLYEPAQKTDGQRVLVDRLWPRGVTKAEAAIDIWLKEVAPSNDLRQWFHEDPACRYDEFAKRYQKELQTNQTTIKPLLEQLQRPCMLITAVKDIEHSHIPTLQQFMAKLQ